MCKCKYSNKKKNKNKLLTMMLMLFFSIAVVFFTGSIAQAESVAFDTFEYWDSPLNHGWRNSDPAYPVYGYGVGTGTSQTLVDYAEGSRVLQVSSTPSVFNQLEPYSLYNYNLIDSQTGNLLNKRAISFKIRAPLAVESFALFKFCVVVTTTDDVTKTIVYRPVEGPGPADKGDYIDVCLGRQYQDGTWHLVARDLDADIWAAMPGTSLREINGIIVKGNQYRLDEILFHDDLRFIANNPPELWKIGPQFATIFTPFQSLIYARDPDGDMLDFVVTIGGYGANGSSTNSNMAIRLPLDPDNLNSGIMPDVVLMKFVPNVLQDLVVTVRVTDGMLSDVETFPLSVVNYPVSGMNRPPLLEELNAAVGHVGEEFVYDVLAHDPDYGDLITFSATINGLPSYQFGPWSYNIIDPVTGQINFTPLFEGEFRIVITVRDSRGMTAQGVLNLTVANQGTWLNHDPVLCKHIQDPQVASAGVPFSIPVEFVDPDGEKLNYSCNVGAVTERIDGVQGAVFSFFTNFPGQYTVNIVAYDDRGGLAQQTFMLDVQPFWAY